MLPGSGLFKDLPCPFYQDGQCNRPYCHFKHISKQAPEKIAQKKPTYTPTPITKAKFESSSDPVPKKKPKLEYIPVSSIAITKNLKYNPSSKVKSQQATYVPSEIKTNTESGEDSNEAAKIYVPTKISDTENVLQNETKEEPTTTPAPDIITEVKIELPEKEESDNPKESQETEEQLITNSIKSAEKESTETILKDNNKTKTNGIDIKSEKSKNENKSDKKDRNGHDKSRDHRHSHSKSSSREKERDKKHSSSHSTSSSHKSHKSDKSHKSSSSSSKHRSSSSNKSERSEKTRESDRKHEKNEKSSSSEKSKRSEKSERSHKSEKSDKHHHSSSSSSSSKSKHREKDKNKEKSDKSKDEPKKQEEKDFVMSQVYEFDEPALNTDYDMNFSSDEEEVMKQCRMIFDEYDTTEQESTDEKRKQEISSKTVLKEDEPMAESSSSRKRQAHENAEKSRVLPAFLGKPNHVQNAMQSIYIRQEMVRKQKEKELAELEKKKKTLEEELKINNQTNMTPLINPAVFAHPAKRSIAPVSNLIALQEAKKKVEALKAAKQSPYQRDMTLAKTVSKGESRVAHVTKVDLVSKPAPPVLEPHQRKISYNIRMQYYNIMVTHCLNIYPNCEDAWDRAQTEELSVFNKCSTPNIYKSSALLTINKLKKESIDAGNKNTQQLKIISHDVMLAGKQGMKSSWSTNNKVKVADSDSSLMTIDNCSSTQAYELVVDCILTEKLLEENGFPRAGNKRGTAKLFTTKPSKPPKDNERYCSRCSKVFMLDDYDEPGVDLCNYHLKRSGYRRGFADNIYYCCQQSAGSDGCCFANYHVTDYVDYDNLTGYVTTMDPDEDYMPSKKDMFALDCEMCYTTFGMELTRITVVNFDENVVYDTLVKPENRVIDYNTKFSGITEQSLKNVRTTLRDVQAVLLSMFNSKTILIGHSLDSDLKALKLIHSTVVDTSVLYPHKMGPPRKRALKTLCIEYLKKIIQEDEQGHDSSEDSLVCIQLVKHYLRNRIVYIN